MTIDRETDGQADEVKEKERETEGGGTEREKKDSTRRCGGRRRNVLKKEVFCSSGQNVKVLRLLVLQPEGGQKGRKSQRSVKREKKKRPTRHQRLSMIRW